MKQSIILLTVILSCLNFASTHATNRMDTTTVRPSFIIPNTLADVPASFPGGKKQLSQWLRTNLEYPAVAEKNGIEGRVIIEFVVDELGQLNQFNVLRGIGVGCDRTAIETLKQMPNWTPASMNGTTVPVRYQIALEFKLR